MTALVSEKLRPDVKKIMEIRASYEEETFKEFVNKKKLEGISINQESLLSDGRLELEFSRYFSTYVALKRNTFIPKDVKFESIDADGISVEWIICPNVEKDKVFFYLFGGGYCMGTTETRRWLPFLVGRAANIRSLTIGYRLAPEYPFPVALEDSIKAYRWLLSTGISPKNIIIGGDSAGGALAVSSMLKLQELNLPLPAGAVLLSPWSDLAVTGKSIETNAIFEPRITREMLRGMAKNYYGNNDPKDPLISPLYAILDNLPPMLIHAGNVETLRDDSVRLAENAKTAGVDVQWEVFDDMLHVFHNNYDELPESNQAIEEIGEYIHKILN